VTLLKLESPTAVLLKTRLNLEKDGLKLPYLSLGKVQLAKFPNVGENAPLLPRLKADLGIENLSLAATIPACRDRELALILDLPSVSVSELPLGRLIEITA
jgi:hypothetical protein